MRTPVENIRVSGKRGAGRNPVHEDVFAFRLEE